MLRQNFAVSSDLLTDLAHLRPLEERFDKLRKGSVQLPLRAEASPRLLRALAQSGDSWDGVEVLDGPRERCDRFGSSTIQAQQAALAVFSQSQNRLMR